MPRSSGATSTTFSNATTYSRTRNRAVCSCSTHRTGPIVCGSELPFEIQAQIVDKRLRFFVIDAYAVAQAAGMGTRINTIMQTCFFAISGVLPREQAIAQIKHAIAKTYQKRGDAVVQRNYDAVDATLAHLHEVAVPASPTASYRIPPIVPGHAPDFVTRVTAVMLANQGDRLPVSAFPVDGTWPTATSQWEKRNVATEIPVWDPAVCIQCNKCAMVCPHAAIRVKVYDPARLDTAPEDVQSHGLSRTGLRRPLHRAGGAGGLHRLPAVRDGVPGQGQGQSAPQGDRHGGASAASRGGARELRVLPRRCRRRTARRSTLT